MEETLQKQHNYPGYLDHRKEHEGFILELKKLEGQLQQEGASFPRVIQTNQTMVSWLIKHIIGMDKEMALFVRSNG
jgi:hemerythrin